MPESETPLSNAGVWRFFDEAEPDDEFGHAVAFS